MADQLKTEWELRADLEAKERRARQISFADETAAEFRAAPLTGCRPMTDDTQDIVAALRDTPHNVRFSRAASDLIEAQAAEIERLRETLVGIIGMTDAAVCAPLAAERWLDRIEEDARAALNEKGPGDEAEAS